MRHIDTSRFGRLTIDEGSIVTFPEGLIRYPQIREFATLAIEDYFPFLIFTSVEQSQRNVCFPVISPAFVFPDYQPSIPAADRRLLEVDSLDDIQIYCIVSFDRKEPKTRVNLKNPLVLNIARMAGCQSNLAGEDHVLQRAVDIGHIVSRSFP